MNAEKANRNRAVLGAMHPGMFVEVSTSATPDFDGGCRQLPPPPPRIQWERDFDDPGWVSAELEDGASLLLPHLRGR